MTRGRKPKPHNLRVIEGNPGKRSMSKNIPLPPVSAGLSAPAHLNKDGKQHWKEMARRLEVLGLLTAIDRGALATLCQAYGVWADAERRLRAYNASEKGQNAGAYLIETPSGAIMQHPLVTISRDARRDYLKASAEFGMTPSARSRVEVGKAAGGNAPPASKFAGMIGGKRGS